MKSFILLLSAFILCSCAETPKKKKVSSAREMAYKKWCLSNVDVTKGIKVNRTENAISMVAPKYPKKALKKKVSGCVHVVFDVDGLGRVTNLRILKAFPRQHGFEKSTKQAVYGWRYNQAPKKNIYLRMDYTL